MTINDLIEIIKEYNPEEIEIVKKAFDYAKIYMKGRCVKVESNI